MKVKMLLLKYLPFYVFQFILNLKFGYFILDIFFHLCKYLCWLVEMECLANDGIDFHIK